MPRFYARFNSTRSLRVVVAGIILGATTLSGCSSIPSVMPPVRETPAASQSAPSAQVSAARSQSLERAVAGINAQTVRAWIDRYSAPKSATTPRNQAREIRIDIDALARRHVAWQLADELESGAIAPTDARQIGVNLSPLAPKGSGVAASPNGQLAIPNISNLPARAARSVTASVSQRPAIVASRATLNDFLSDLRARQNDLESAESELARRALEDRIRAATRGAVEAVSLAPVSPETALRLSNLRLQLLDQLRAPAAQKAVAAAKIEAIEAQLNEIWERQTAQQNARLRAAFEELPARLRREGLQALDAAAAKRETQRYNARLELRGLVENRLNGATPDAGDTQTLRLLLPPALVASTDLSVQRNISSQTNARRAASAPTRDNDELRDARANRALGQVAPINGVSVAKLRATARADARQWAGKLALSWNARLSDEPDALDRTALAVRQLFGAPASEIENRH